VSTFSLSEKSETLLFQNKIANNMCLPGRRNNHHSVTQLFEPQETQKYNTRADVIALIFDSPHCQTLLNIAHKNVKNTS
jgi:hypothetical protein